MSSVTDDIVLVFIQIFVGVLVTGFVVLLIFGIHSLVTFEAPPEPVISEACIQKLEYMAGELDFNVNRCQRDLDKVDELRGVSQCE